MAKSTKVPVSERALIQRINRKLRHDDEMLKVARGGRTEQSVGRYYIINFNRNWIVSQNVDPETVGRELGVLAEWEQVVEE